MAVDVQVLYDDLGAVSDLPAAVAAQGLAGPGKNRAVDSSGMLWFQSQHWCQGFIPAISNLLPQV